MLQRLLRAQRRQDSRSVRIKRKIQVPTPRSAQQDLGKPLQEFPTCLLGGGEKGIKEKREEEVYYFMICPSKMLKSGSEDSFVGNEQRG